MKRIRSDQSSFRFVFNFKNIVLQLPGIEHTMYFTIFEIIIQKLAISNRLLHFYFTDTDEWAVRPLSSILFEVVGKISI